MLKQKKLTKNTDVQVDINKVKELVIYTKDGAISFDTKGLYQIEGYGKYQKDRFQRIIKRVFARQGVLKVVDGDKVKRIDLTMQTKDPVLVEKNN